MNNENELNPTNDKDIFNVQGNYFNSVKGDYVEGNYFDNSTNINLEFKLPDPTVDNPNNVPFVISQHFVGREKDLDDLHKLLEQNQTVAISAIAGMGGVGKTELVIQYAHKYQNEYPGSICWLRAREDIGLQIVDFAKSAFNLNIPEGLDLETQVRYCWNHWSQENSLIVLDDLPNYGKYYRENIKPYLPSKQPYFNLLITSRQQPGRNFKCINLNVLSPEAAAALIISLAENSEIDFEADNSKLQELCEWLGYLPLGLELIGRYLDLHPTYSIEKVIGKLEAKKLQARALQNPEDADMNAQLGVAAAFDLSWDDITEELANKNQKLGNSFQELAGYLGLFKSEPFVWEFVEYGLLGIEESEEREDKIEELEELRDGYLVRRNLLKRNINETYQLHSLIQEYFRAKLENLEQKEILKQKFTLPMIAIAQSIPNTPTQEDIKNVALAIPHLSNVVTELIDYVEDDHLILPFLGLGKFYNGQGLYNQAEKWSKESLQICRNRLGQEHPNVATSLNNLAELYRSQGRYSEAEPLYVQSLEMGRKLLGQEHPDVATGLNNIALLYYSQGRYSEAEPLYVQSLEMGRKLLGQEHPGVIKTLQNLAYLYYSQGKYRDAELLFIQALEMYRKLLGHEHPDIINTLNNLALLYKSQGRYSDAESLFIQSLDMTRKLLGQKHPDVALSLNNLALLYYSQGRYSDAEPLYIQALDMSSKLLGHEHPLIATYINNLAILYCSQGRYSDAEPLCIQALEMYRKLLGHEHSSVAQSLSNLAELYRLQERYDEAEPLYLNALEIHRKLLGKEHPDVATSLNNLATLYKSQGRYSEAEPLYLDVLEIQRKLLGKEHPDVTTSLNNLAALYKSQGRYSEAEPLYLDALAMTRKLLGQEHPDVATSLNNLASLYESQERHDESVYFYQQALEIAEKALGENHPNTNTIRANMQNMQRVFMMQLFQMPEEEVKQMLPPEIFEQFLQAKHQYQSESNQPNN